MMLAAQPSRLAPMLVLSCVLFASLAGCGHRTKKEAARACNKAKLALLTAVSHDDFAEARSLRAGAYRDCADRTELSALDRKIVDGESNQRSREALATRRTRERDEFVRFFLEFVRAHRNAPDQASARARCDTPALATSNAARGGSAALGAAVPPRFCTAHRLVSNQRTLEIRYDADDPSAFRFTTNVEGALDCAALGARQTKTWSVSAPGGGTTPRESCAFDGALAGLVAVVGGGNASSLHVFSPSYLEREPGARRTLDVVR
jgi:hypothetical protein